MTNAQAGFLLFCVRYRMSDTVYTGRYTQGQVLLLKGCWSCRCLEPGFSGLINGVFHELYYGAGSVLSFLQLPPALCSQVALNKGLRILGGKRGFRSDLRLVLCFGVCDKSDMRFGFWALYASTENSHDSMFRTILAMSLAVMVAGALVQLTFADESASLQQASEAKKFKLSGRRQSYKEPLSVVGFLS